MVTARTDTSEKGLESLIVAAMTGWPPIPTSGGDGLAGNAAKEPAAPYGGTGWIRGEAADYNRAYAVDLAQLRAFVAATQKSMMAAFDLDHDTPTRQKFLARLQGEMTKRGVIDVLRKGVEHQAHHLELFYGTPSAG